MRRQLNGVDRLLSGLDEGLRTVFGHPRVTERPNPGDDWDMPELDEAQRRLVEGLMRVNHAGEVSAQGLYQGQALTARLPQVRDAMERAAHEENDHLAWCRQRVEELGGHTSYLDPFWYAGSFTIGAIAGLAGDRWSLGFVEETEHQVVRHLERHLQQLPESDRRSRAILEQMKIDEEHHGTVARNAGAAALPGPIKAAMQLVSRIMTTTARRI